MYIGSFQKGLGQLFPINSFSSRILPNWLVSLGMTNPISHNTITNHGQVSHYMGGGMSTGSDFDEILKAGESDTVEFLSAVIMPRFVQTICAMSNSKGGTIYIGVVDPSKDSDNDQAEAWIINIRGVEPRDVQNVVQNLENHFDDPLPEVDVELLDERGSQGPVVVVHVKRYSGTHQIALNDLSIWERNNAQNVSISRRARPIRPRAVIIQQENEDDQNTSIETPHGDPNSNDINEESENRPDNSRPQPIASPSNVARLGSRSIIRREASSNEVALNVDGYTQVIANLLKSTDDDERMSLAIFGHWGRGKTFLAKKIAELLDSDTKSSPKYTTVLFSAWRYRTTPEVWAYLFERFLQEGKKESFLLPLRASLVRHGPWPLIFAMFGLFLSLWTMGERAQLLPSLIQVVGVSTVVYGAFLYIRFRSVTFRLKSLYKFASHSDKLGLQAAIGDDLRALLLAWCRKDPKTFTKKHLVTLLWPYLIYMTAALMITWKLWPVMEKTNWTIPLIGEFSNGVNIYFGLMIYSVWCLFWVVIPYVLYFFPRKSTGRVLLVVDDLDRCEPIQMLEIIESTMLILDDEDVHQHLQVCMLIDESAFFHALIDKYDHLLNIEHLDREHQYSPARIFRENLEKFFLIHLRLSALTDNEIAEVMEGYVQELRGTDKPESHLQQTPVDTEVTGSPDTGQTEPARDSGQAEAETTLESDSVIEPEEADAILAAVYTHLLSGDEREMIGPRTLRCLLFRYQLARNILSKLGTHPEASQLADVVVSIYAGTMNSTNLQTIVEKVVRQVS